MKIASANIRFESQKDGPNDWPYRAPLLSSIINLHDTELLGTQEGREPQLRSLEKRLPSLTLIDDHRAWIENRMYPCLFYNEAVFELINSGDIWLSSTPEIPASKSFGSLFPRLCTWARLKNKNDKSSTLFLNTHLDHLSSKTRIQQVRVLKEEVSKIYGPHEQMILMGDFNEGPGQDVHHFLLKTLKLIDCYEEMGLQEVASHHKFSDQRNGFERIDWILRSQNLKTNSIKLSQESLNGLYPSDHLPVLAVFNPSKPRQA